MNRQNAKDYLPLVQALADGKTIQFKNDGAWDDCASTWDFSWALTPDRYRIKPEPRKFEVFLSRKTDTMVMAKYCCDLNTTPDRNASPCRRCCYTETRIRNKK